MKGIFSPDSPLSAFLQKLGELVVLSVVWFLTSIPVITIGVSTTALYYAVTKSVRKGRGYAIKEFFHAWKMNFGKSTVMTLLLEVVSLLAWTLGSDMYEKLLNAADGIEILDISYESVTGVYLISIVLLFFVLSLFNYIFPLLSRFDMSIGRILAMGFVLAIRYFYYTIAMIVILCAGAYFTWKVPVTILLAPGLWAWLSSFLLEKTMKSYLPEPKEGEDAWWAEL